MSNELLKQVHELEAILMDDTERTEPHTSAVVAGLDISLQQMLDIAQEVVLLEADYFELRFDSLIKEDRTLESVRSLMGVFNPHEVIFTYRTEDVEDAERVYNEACRLGARYIDVDGLMLRYIDINMDKSQLIASYHNFQKTPVKNELEQIVNNLKTLGADVVKIATMINTWSDIELLADLLIENPNSIIIGMGEMGKVTRIVFPLYGSLWSYGSVAKSVSAPGQLSITKLNFYWNQL